MNDEIDAESPEIDPALIPPQGYPGGEPHEWAKPDAEGIAIYEDALRRKIIREELARAGNADAPVNTAVTMANTKAEIMAALDALDIEYAEHATKEELLTILDSAGR